MLHLIFQSPIAHSVLQRIESGDDVVFFENAVFRLIKGTILSSELQQMLNNNVHLWVLSAELDTRGIQINKLIQGVEVIDFVGVVKLTEKNKVIRTWS
jgi:tRNA 2-thiouridine synthesizing protein B